MAGLLNDFRQLTWKYFQKPNNNVEKQNSDEYQNMLKMVGKTSQFWEHSHIGLLIVHSPFDISRTVQFLGYQTNHHLQRGEKAATK